MSELKLNLGCGSNKLEGFVNVDKFGEPDLRFDLETFPWPWEESSVSFILLSHVLEHLGQETDIYLNIIKELYRVCEHHAVIDIRVPHPRHDDFITDPTHVRMITSRGLEMFSKKANLYWQENNYANTPLGLYLDVDFEIMDTMHYLTPAWLKMQEEENMTDEEVKFALDTYYNVCQQIDIKLQVIKN